MGRSRVDFIEALEGVRLARESVRVPGRVRHHCCRFCHEEVATSLLELGVSLPCESDRGLLFHFSVLFFCLFLFLYHVFIVKVQETAWSAGNDINKTINNPTTGFTTS